ncbi:MAG: tRNA preQ1(34) S-adenosylmethionine ribosyltransferase-isomerase QueA [Coraliomargaritaceae bacterium]
MDATLFDYHLPQDRIAQEPTPQRDESRLMVVDRATKEVTHTYFRQIGRYLPNNARYFRNNAAVLKARLHGNRPGGGRVECLLLQPADEPNCWWCLLKPGKKAAATGFSLKGNYQAEVLQVGENGHYRVHFQLFQDESVIELTQRIGIVPLPPYIERNEQDPRSELDDERYQTVYANYDKQIAVAAPTAGLHFTPDLIDQLEVAGAIFYDLTLQVGIGTFHPVQAEQIEDHPIHKEWYEIPSAAYRAIQSKDPGPRVAVGTTSVRSIEDAMRCTISDPGENLSEEGDFCAEANLFLYPPAQFHAVDHLITNFHLPKSTLLCLVAAFLDPNGSSGIQWLQQLYKEAVQEKYRFYSYGDAMLIL